jgi:hypothetical protein
MDTKAASRGGDQTTLIVLAMRSETATLHDAGID